MNARMFDEVSCASSGKIKGGNSQDEEFMGKNQTVEDGLLC